MKTRELIKMFEITKIQMEDQMRMGPTYLAAIDYAIRMQDINWLTRYRNGNEEECKKCDQEMI